ncbi:MAG: tetratricopeptide repeat protein [Candidatus Aminicenantes bacterium]|nr:tetratricopeptide repeat protein [Candidatus Aminicenantes bacterium]
MIKPAGFKVFLSFVFSLALSFVFYSCQTHKTLPRTEPVSPQTALVVSPEELFSKGEAELQKFTKPGYRAAADYFEQVLKLKPDFAPVYGRLAITYGLLAKEKNDLGLNNLEQWVKSYYFSLKAKELGLEADYLKALALTDNSRNFISRQEYEQFFREIRNNFRKEPAEFRLSYLQDLFSIGAFKRQVLNQPLKELDKVLKKNPEDVEALLFKALVQLITAEDPNLVRVMELRPDWSLPYFLLGLFQKSRGEIPQAEKWFNLTLQKNPEHPRALSELGELAFLGKKYEEAEKYLEAALSIDGEMPRAHLLLALILREKGEYEQALDHLQSITALIPEHEESLYYQSLILVEMADWTSSLESLQALIEVGGSYEIFGYALRALSYLMLNRLAEAEADSHRALEISSGYYLPYYILGLINFRREEWKKASENFRQSLKIDRTFDDGHYFLGQTYLKLKDSRKAREELCLAADIFEQEIKQVESLLNQSRTRGWTRKAERLESQKKELEVKARNCRQLLSSL